MKKKCNNCDSEFEAKRSSAKFCSDTCKTLFNRKQNEKPISLSQKIDFIYDFINSFLENKSLNCDKITEQKQHIPEKLPNESSLAYKIRISESLKTN